MLFGSTVLPVVQRLGVPVVVLNLQPEPAIDYDRLNAMGDRGRMTGEWLAHCQACSVPEVACVFNRLGLRYDIVTGYLAEDAVWKRIGAWVDAARAASELRRNRMGVLGHYYCGMLDVYTDLTRLSGVFGTHFELLEMCELKTLRDEATSQQVAAKIDEFYETFDVASDCERSEIERAARTSVALDRAGRPARSRVDGLLLRRDGRLREHRHIGDRRQYAAYRAGSSRSRRVRGQERSCDEDHGAARRRRLFLRTLCDGFRRRRRAVGT